jgi:hypothetical protein
VVFFYWVLVMFRQCGIFLLGFGNVPAVRYFFAFHFISITESRYHFCNIESWIGSQTEMSNI